MICKNDGHAWAEIFIDGVRQRWDVTPTITDPDDPIQSEQVLDEKDPLDITTEQSHNMSLKKQLLAILKAEYQHSAPEVKITDIQAQLRE